MFINRVEFTTNNNVAHVHQFHIENNVIIESHDVMSFPVADWANKYEIEAEMIKLCVKTNRWPR